MIEKARTTKREVNFQLNQIKTLSEEEFRKHLGAKLGQHLEHAVVVLNDFGPRLSFDVANVLFHAADQGKEEEVLAILREHWITHLQFQHPEIRGNVCSCMGDNETEQMFLRICEQTLALTPTTAACV